MVRQERKKLEIETSDSESDSSESSDREPYACPGKNKLLIVLVGSVAFGLPTLAVTRRSNLAMY
jgi:hypothetical protein